MPSPPSHTSGTVSHQIPDLVRGLWALKFPITIAGVSDVSRMYIRYFEYAARHKNSYHALNISWAFFLTTSHKNETKAKLFDQSIFWETTASG